DLTTEDHLFLLAHDSDPFNRWQSAQTIAFSTLVAGTHAARRGDVLSLDHRLINGLKDTLADDSLDPAFRALVLAMPGESDIAREIGVDVDP
ncbi:aminopeptidase N C-terminal domain-containing protein, partial [Acinetobacter baumannii]